MPKRYSVCGIWGITRWPRGLRKEKKRRRVVPMDCIVDLSSYFRILLSSLVPRFIRSLKNKQTRTPMLFFEIKRLICLFTASYYLCSFTPRSPSTAQIAHIRSCGSPRSAVSSCRNGKQRSKCESQGAEHAMCALGGF